MAYEFSEGQSASAGSAASPLRAEFSTEIARKQDVQIVPLDQAQGQADQTQQPEAPLSPAMQKAVDAAKAFDAEPDKAKAYKEQGPNFAEAVRLADTAFSTAMEQAKKDFTAIQPQAEAANTDIEAATKNVQTVFNGLSPADKQKAAALVQEAQQDPSKGEDVMKRMKEQLPTLAAAFENVDSQIHKHEATLRKMAEIEAGPQAALQDSAATRQIYMEAAGAGGDQAKASELQVELLRLMFGQTPDQLKEKAPAPQK